MSLTEGQQKKDTELLRADSNIIHDGLDQIAEKFLLIIPAVMFGYLFLLGVSDFVSRAKGVITRLLQSFNPVAYGDGMSY